MLNHWGNMKLAAFAFAALLSALGGSLAQARKASADTITVTVSAGCGSIAACIVTANPGDTISIPAGQYTESVTLDKAVSLIGASPANRIWNAATGDRVLTVTAPMTVV